MDELLLQFRYEHLPGDALQTLGKYFYEVAHVCAKYLPDSTARVPAVQKLLRARNDTLGAMLCPPIE